MYDPANRDNGAMMISHQQSGMELQSGDAMMQQSSMADIRNEEDWGFFDGDYARPQKQEKAAEVHTETKTAPVKTFQPRPAETGTALVKASVPKSSYSVISPGHKKFLQQQFEKHAVGMSYLSGHSVGEIQDAYDDKRNVLKFHYNHVSNAKLAIGLGAVASLFILAVLPPLALVPALAAAGGAFRLRTVRKAVHNEISDFQSRRKALPPLQEKKPADRKKKDLKMM